MRKTFIRRDAAAQRFDGAKLQFEWFDVAVGDGNESDGSLVDLLTR